MERRSFLGVCTLLPFLLPVALKAKAAARTHTVRIAGMKFDPEKLDVAVGDTVVWVNEDIVPHTVTSPKAGLESGELANGARWRWKATKPGTIAYICRLHPVMHGSLIVTR